MGRMWITTSFATSFALSAATSHVIIHVVLSYSICYDEFVSSSMTGKLSSLYQWRCPRMVTEAGKWPTFCDDSHFVTAARQWQETGSVRHILIVTEAQDSCSFQRHQNQIQWIVAKFMGNSTSIRQDMPTMGLSIINVGEKKSYMATIVNQLHYYCKLIFSLLCQNNGPWVFR